MSMKQDEKSKETTKTNEMNDKKISITFPPSSSSPSMKKNDEKIILKMTIESSPTPKINEDHVQHPEPPIRPPSLVLYKLDDIDDDDDELSVLRAKSTRRNNNIPRGKSPLTNLMFTGLFNNLLSSILPPKQQQDNFFGNDDDYHEDNQNIRMDNNNHHHPFGNDNDNPSLRDRLTLIFFKIPPKEQSSSSSSRHNRSTQTTRPFFMQTKLPKMMKQNLFPFQRSSQTTNIMDNSLRSEQLDHIREELLQIRQRHRQLLRQIGRLIREFEHI